MVVFFRVFTCALRLYHALKLHAHYRFLGQLCVGEDRKKRNVFVVPMLYIAGNSRFSCCVPPRQVLIVARADLPEVRRLCGISTCPDCDQQLQRSRRDFDHEDIRAEAIALRRQVGKKGAAAELLKTVGMAPTHMYCDCPFVGRIAHMTPACFPGDRLHLQ